MSVLKFDSESITHKSFEGLVNEILIQLSHLNFEWSKTNHPVTENRKLICYVKEAFKNGEFPRAVKTETSDRL